MFDFVSQIPLAQAAAAGGGTNPFLSMLIPFAGIFLVFYFLIIRPRNKKEKEHRKLLASAKKGDKVVTIGGLHGVIASTKDETVIIKVDEDVKLEFSRSALASVVPAGNDKVEVAEVITTTDKK